MLTIEVVLSYFLQVTRSVIPNIWQVLHNFFNPLLNRQLQGYVYREDTKQDVQDFEVPSSYEEYYGEPEVTGHIYSFSWEHIKTRDYYRDLRKSIAGPDSPFYKEYESIKELLNRLTQKVAAKPKSKSIFDRFS